MSKKTLKKKKNSKTKTKKTKSGSKQFDNILSTEDPFDTDKNPDSNSPVKHPKTMKGVRLKKEYVLNKKDKH